MQIYVQMAVFVPVHFSRNSSCLVGVTPRTSTFGHVASPMRFCRSDSLMRLVLKRSQNILIAFVCFSFVCK